jgi:hypothetical protein
MRDSRLHCILKADLWQADVVYLGGVENKEILRILSVFILHHCREHVNDSA